MKRELLQNIRIQPYTSGTGIERAGFFSAVLGAAIGTVGALTVTVAHSDDGTTFETVTDKLVFPEKPTVKDHDGEFIVDTLAVGDIVNIDIDIAGLKDYIKITVSGAAATDTALAIVLGDNGAQPV